MDAQPFEPSRWSLTDLLPAAEGPALDVLLADLEESVGELEASRERLSPDLPLDDFAHLLQLVEKVAAIVSRLSYYGSLWFSEDTQNQAALAFRGRMERLNADISNRTLFFDLWWKGLDEGAAARLQQVSGDNRYYLESLRRFRSHTLSEPEEKVVNLKNLSGRQALETLHDMLTLAFTFRIVVDGEEKELTRAQLMVYARDPRPEVREAAYREMYRVYCAQATVLGELYQFIVRDWASENLDLRRFTLPISVRNLRNDIPDDVARTLLEVCRQNAPLFQRYFRLKARWVGLPKLRRYDIYAPLSRTDRTYPFGAAVELVLSSLGDFSPVLAEHARRVLADGHLDSEIRPRKDTGAFCASVQPGLAPWVLMNYNGRPEDVATLAHELGHAVHSLMAADHSQLTFHSALPMAETASTFAEMLLLERMLAQEPDAALRRDLLARSVDDSYATVMRQAFFVMFENEAHSLVPQGVTSDALSERYLANLAEQFGDAVEVSDEFRWEWVSVPHIYITPFYCYAYSFGQLLVLSLYRQYKSEGASFVPRYLRILAHGGSSCPAAILEEAGVDMASAAFWQGGFDVISDMVRQLEELA